VTHDEAAELLGAYALHAVDDDERALIDAHLETCPRCRAELRDHEAVAGLLGNSGGDAPDGLWDRIADALEEQPPPMRLDLPPGQGAVIPIARRRPSRALLAAAAAIVAIATLGAVVIRQDDRIDDLQQAMADEGVLRAANLALRDPGAAEAALRSPDGTLTATAVVLPDGSGYLLLDDVPDLAADRTYQLWGRTDGGLISLGLLGDRPDEVVPFRAAGDVDALAITEEDAPGVVQSRNQPVLAGDLT
jgi:anti-sigma factor RsiW